MEIDLYELEKGQPHWLSGESAKRRAERPVPQSLKEAAARKLVRLVRQVAEHLPGKHEQKDHGRDGADNGGGETNKPQAAKPQAAAFVSPNIDEGLQVQDAVRRIRGQRHLEMQKVFQSVDKAAGLGVQNESAIGAWADGAENSIVCRFPEGTDFDTVRAVAAMKGLIGEQKAVLVFQPAEDGPHSLVEVHVKGDVQQVHDDLLAAGIEFHTLVPREEGALSAFIYTQDDSLNDAILNYVRGHDAGFQVAKGTGEFIGSWDSREEGAAAYERVVADYEGRGEAARKVVGQWRSLRDHWRSAAAKFKAAETAARERAVAAIQRVIARRLIQREIDGS